MTNSSGKGAFQAATPLETSSRPERQTRGELNLLRKGGSIPAILYGKGLPCVKVSVPAKQFAKIMETAKAVYSQIFDLGSFGLALVKQMQFLPINDQVIHLDFLKLTEGSKVSVPVPLKFLGEDACPGIRQGGILNPVHHSLNLSVGYQNIPHEIEIDVSKLNLGGAIHLKDIQLPEDVSVLGVSAEETLVSILHPAGAESETKEGE